MLPNPDSARLRSIFHPSDFTEASEVAFAHALKFALQTGATLNVLHVSMESDLDWHQFPGVREMLARWKLIPEHSPRHAVSDLGFDVEKVISRSEDPVTACTEFLTRHPADLIVLAVHQNEGRMRWLHQAVAEPLARRSGQMTLFIPYGLEGFVSRQDGSVNLRNILIPVAAKPRPEPSVEAVSRIIHQLKLPTGAVRLLHVGEPGEMPAFETPEDAGWTWSRRTEPGDAVETILRHAGDIHADLIVMTTDGPEGFLDGLRGTTSEHVLRRADCPVAVLPVGATPD